MEAPGQRAAGARTRYGQCCQQTLVSIAQLARAWTHRSVLGTVGRRDATALQDMGTSPGGGCSRAAKPQRGPAMAGLTCVCPATELPAQPLMGKACGQTSSSDRGNTQSIIRASGFLHCFPPANARPARSAEASPAARQAHAWCWGKGRRNLQWAEMQAAQRAGCEPRQELPVCAAARGCPGRLG